MDRGSRVKMDDLLIELFVPELVAAVEQAKASLGRPPVRPWCGPGEDQRAPPRSSSPRRPTRRRPTPTCGRGRPRGEYRDKQYVRISQLVERGAVEERLKDEEEDRERRPARRSPPPSRRSPPPGPTSPRPRPCSPRPTPTSRVPRPTSRSPGESRQGDGAGVVHAHQIAVRRRGHLPRRGRAQGGVRPVRRSGHGRGADAHRRHGFDDADHHPRPGSRRAVLRPRRPRHRPG